MGSLLGTAAKNKVDKLTFISDESLASFSDWVEQLIAESTGKSGTGILPVVGEEFTSDLSRYGSDRLFVLHQLNASEKMGKIAQKLNNARLPFIQIQLKDKYELGGLMLIWELATAIAGHIMEIHPFNQPNVESAKILAKKSVHSYEESGKLPDQNTSPLTPESVTEFLQTLRPGDYVSLQAYVDPSISIERAFRELQAALRDKYHVAVTFGLGPRFLHSTGQLHKGDAGRGVFLQFVSHPDEDIPIPDQPGSKESFITFGILKKAQAIGDAKALIQAQRRLITFSIDKSIDENISTLAARL